MNDQEALSLLHTVVDALVESGGSEHRVRGFGVFTLEPHPFLERLSTLRFRLDPEARDALATDDGVQALPAVARPLLTRVLASPGSKWKSGWGSVRLSRTVTRGRTLVALTVTPGEQVCRRLTRLGTDPFVAPGLVRLDRNVGGLLRDLRPSPAAAPPSDDLEAVLADPRFADVHTVEVRGATDVDATLLAGSGRVLRLLDGDVTDVGAAAVARCRGSLDGNAVGRGGLAALGPDMDPGRQRLVSQERLDHRDFHVPRDDLDTLLEAWTERVATGVATVLVRVGLGDGGLRGVAPVLVGDSRWAAIDGVRSRGTRIPPVLAALRGLVIAEQGPSLAAARLVSASIGVFEPLAAGLDDDPGSHGPGLAGLVSLVEGTVACWRTDAIPALWPDPAVYAALAEDARALQA